MIKEFFIRLIYRTSITKSQYIRLIDGVKNGLVKGLDYLKDNTDMNDDDKISIGEVIIILSQVFKHIMDIIKGKTIYDE